jgi:hypothetical protein
MMRPMSPGGHRPALVVEHLHVIARHRLGRRAGLDRQRLDAQAVGGDGPAGLGLPPVIDHRHAEDLARPVQVSGSQRSPARNSARSLLVS